MPCQQKQIISTLAKLEFYFQVYDNYDICGTTLDTTQKKIVKKNSGYLFDILYFYYKIYNGRTKELENRIKLMEENAVSNYSDSNDHFMEEIAKEREFTTSETQKPLTESSMVNMCKYLLPLRIFENC